MNQSLRKSIKKLRGKIKKSDFIFAMRRSIVDKDLKRERKAMAKCTVKTTAQINEEIHNYKHFWKRIPQDYIRYGLFNKNLSREEINDYIPMQYYYCEFYDSLFSSLNEKTSASDFVKETFPETYRRLYLFPQSVLRAIRYGKDLSDKLLQYLILEERNIPVPPVIAVLQNHQLYTLHGQPAESSILLNSLNHTSRLFVKPTDGCGGAGIKVLTRNGDSLCVDNFPIKELSDIKTDAGRVYIIQEALEQHSLMSRINASSVNTLRVLVKYNAGKPDIIGIILRMGRKGSHVDNSAVGGISVGIDNETGNFYDSAGREHGAGTFERHPDSNFQFSGASIPDWSAILKEITTIVGRITEIPLVGWDFAIGKDRVEALEFNMGFGIEHAQTILGGLRRRLGIKL